MGEVLLEILINLVIELAAPLLGELISRFFVPVLSASIAPLGDRVALVAMGLGAIFGGASLLVFPEAVVTPTWLKVVNLLVTPTIIGFVAVQLGRFRESRDKVAVPTDTFTYGFVFAITYLVVRWIGTW